MSVPVEGDLDSHHLSSGQAASAEKRQDSVQGFDLAQGFEVSA